MAARRGRRLALVDQDTGEVIEQKPRVPHQFEGSGYTLQSTGSEVPLYKLGLTGAEWATLDWLREHGAASAAIRVTPEALSEEIDTNASTCKKALARLTKMALLLKPSPRAAAYQLTPLRYWEGAGSTHVTACKRLAPPRVAPDAKARAKTADAQAARSKTGKAADTVATPIRRAAGETS
ncbi:MarR family transcriptional regulator [Streptomyces sp. NPDC088341]|uniref:MarR family transcriptional regulator n=1 Tax=Streptomyces sp. NPDC088341 TaxID=3154870 RepID=UPI0034430191